MRENKTTIKRIISIILLIALVSGCGSEVKTAKKEAASDAASISSTETVIPEMIATSSEAEEADIPETIPTSSETEDFTASSEEIGTSDNDKKAWIDKYKDYLKGSGAEWYDPGDAAYSLIYVDDDDVPELIVRIGGEDGRYFALTNKDGKFECIELLSGGFGSELDYIPKGNRIRCEGIYSDGVSETIYGIEGDTWNKLFSGSNIDIFSKEEAESHKYYSLKNEGSDEPSYEVYFLEKEELPEKDYFYERNKVYDEEKAEKISFSDGI